METRELSHHRRAFRHFMAEQTIFLIFSDQTPLSGVPGGAHSGASASSLGGPPQGGTQRVDTPQEGNPPSTGEAAHFSLFYPDQTPLSGVPGGEMEVDHSATSTVSSTHFGPGPALVVHNAPPALVGGVGLSILPSLSEEGGIC